MGLHIVDDDEKRVESVDYQQNTYRSNVANNRDDEVQEGIGRTKLGKTRSGSTLLRELTSSNLNMLEIQNTKVTDPGHCGDIGDELESLDHKSEMETPVGGQMVMGQAQ